MCATFPTGDREGIERMNGIEGIEGIGDTWDREDEWIEMG